MLWLDLICHIKWRSPKYEVFFWKKSCWMRLDVERGRYNIRAITHYPLWYWILTTIIYIQQVILSGPDDLYSPAWVMKMQMTGKRSKHFLNFRTFDAGVNFSAFDSNVIFCTITYILPSIFGLMWQLAWLYTICCELYLLHFWICNRVSTHLSWLYMWEFLCLDL